MDTKAGNNTVVYDRIDFWVELLLQSSTWVPVVFFFSISNSCSNYSTATLNNIYEPIKACWAWRRSLLGFYLMIKDCDSEFVELWVCLSLCGLHKMFRDLRLYSAFLCTPRTNVCSVHQHIIIYYNIYLDVLNIQWTWFSGKEKYCYHPIVKWRR